MNNVYSPLHSSVYDFILSLAQTHKWSYKDQFGMIRREDNILVFFKILRVAQPNTTLGMS